MAFLVATTSLPAAYRPNADHWNAVRSCQNYILVLFHHNKIAPESDDRLPPFLRQYGYGERDIFTNIYAFPHLHNFWYGRNLHSSSLLLTQKYLES